MKHRLSKGKTVNIPSPERGILMCDDDGDDVVDGVSCGGEMVVVV